MNKLEKLINLTHARMSAEMRAISESKTIRDLGEHVNALQYFGVVYQLLVALQTLGAEVHMSDEALQRLNIYEEGKDDLPEK